MTPEKRPRPAAPSAGSKIALATATLVTMLTTGPVEARDTGRVFISNERADTITVLDGASFEVVATLSTSKRPQAMAFSQDRSRIYVVAGRGDRLDVIDIASLQIIGSLPAGEYPEMVAVHPTGNAAYVTNEESKTLSVVDLVGGKLAKQIPVCADPEGVALAHDGAQAYVACEGAGAVAVIDTVANRMVAQVKTGPKPRRFAIIPNGRELWVTTEAAGEVQILDTTTNAVAGAVRFEPPGVKREDVRPVGITVSRDGRRAYVGLSRAEVVAVVDVAARRVEAYWPAGKRPWNVALGRGSSGDSLLFVANQQSDDVTVIDIATGKALRSVKVGRSPHSVLVDDKPD